MKGTIVRRVRESAFHPLIFAAFPILSLFVQNLGKGYLGEAALITAGALVLCLVLWLLVNLFVKDRDRAAIVVSAFFLLFFSYGHGRSAVGGLLALVGQEDKIPILLHSSIAQAVWLVLWGLVFALACLAILRVLRKTHVATEALNLMAITLIVILGINAIGASGLPEGLISRMTKPGTSDTSATAPPVTAILEDVSNRVFLPIVARTEKQELTNTEISDSYSDEYQHLWLEGIREGSQVPDPKPDIYYIILDKYVRSDYLEKEFGFDNTAFIAALQNRGFYVPKRSRANYAYTINSLASSLNFMHLDELTTRQGEFFDFDYSKSHWLLAAMIRDSRTSEYLRSLGYTTMAFHTGFWWTELKDADTYLEPTFTGLSTSEYQLGIIDLTPLSAVPALQRSRDDASRQRVLYTLEHIADATEDSTPTFVFAHIISPHPPYVFNADGRPAQFKDHYTYDEYLEAYSNQVAYLNDRLVELVDEILGKSSSPPIIIIQSDHGTCYGTSTEFEPCIAERMSIFNAYYFPSKEYEDLYDDVTPVNTFRIVFNQFFGTDYPLLEDSSYYSRPESYFVLTDVTDRASSDR